MRVKDFKFPESVLLAALVLSGCSQEVKTEIAEWQYDRQGAVSITYDDGTVNQFKVALPVMDRLGLSGTFFINTGRVEGSEWTGEFVGRPIEEIIEEAGRAPTDSANFYERASAMRYVPVEHAREYFDEAGNAIDSGRKSRAYAVVDEFYGKVNRGALQPSEAGADNFEADSEGLTWDDVREYTSRGHEFASHMVTHPFMSALDEANMRYELDRSREELLNQVGIRSTISAECPYGTGDGRAVAYAQKEYPALRNGMHLDYMPEIMRGDDESPVKPECEYVQYNLWLVIVIHGVEGIGWEPVSAADIDEYFSYIADNKGLWVATFGDVTRYIKERMNASVKSVGKCGRIEVTLDHSLDKTLFDLPLTLKTCVDPQWKNVSVTQGGTSVTLPVTSDGNNTVVTYQAMPGGGKIVIKAES